MNKIVLGVIFLAALFTTHAQEGFIPISSPVPQSPPPAPPIVHRPAAKSTAAEPAAAAPSLYSIGQPTDDEQLYLELLNRMRANPTAEGQRLAVLTDPDVLASYSGFSVDLNLMQSQFSTNPPVPPLAMNAQLVAAARWHSGDMFTNQYQGHYQTNGTVVMAPWDRMVAEGYNYTWAGENVFSYSKSVPDGHAAFAVDWGYGTGGMQDPPGHRVNMLSANFREVGMGIIDGVNGSVGPQLITQDFGTRPSASPLLSGVVYYDFNGNGAYDIGEGIGGVSVNVPGSSYSAVTADSGGYTIPLTTNGDYTVTFSASGLSTQTVTTVTSGKNVKVDFLPPYSPPVLSGPNPAYLNQSNTFTFSAVGAATGYQWQQTRLVSYNAVEGAENGLANVTVVSSSGYSVITNDVKASGSYSFHLAQPTAVAQSLTLNPVLRPTANSQLTFSKRLGWASSSQVAKAQVSSDGGVTWQDIWSQTGSDGSGESSFSTVSVSLGAYAGSSIQLRFAYVFTGGNYFYQTSTGVGLYLDNIAVSNASQVMSPVISTVPPGGALAFTPSTNGTYLLQVRAIINSRTLNWGPALTVLTTNPPPSIQLASTPVFVSGRIQLDFTVTNYRTNMSFQLWKTTNPASGWIQDTTATQQTLSLNQKYRFTTSPGAAQSTFYRVLGQ